MSLDGVKFNSMWSNFPIDRSTLGSYVIFKKVKGPRKLENGSFKQKRLLF